MDPLALDFHTHLMPFVDDGSRGAVETVAMARGLAELGVQAAHLTPHQFRFGRELRHEDLGRRTEEVAGWLDEAGIDLRVVAGAEHWYGGRFLDAIARGEALMTFRAQGEECVLVELPCDGPAAGACALGDRLLARGIRPVLAHPERIAARWADPGRLDVWWNAGWRFQLGLLSLVGRYGQAARRVARTLVADGKCTFVGSDIHRPAEVTPLRDAHAEYRALVAGSAVA
jgi:protein-tyrosine phosphatase